MSWWISGRSCKASKSAPDALDSRPWIHVPFANSCKIVPSAGGTQSGFGAGWGASTGCGATAGGAGSDGSAAGGGGGGGGKGVNAGSPGIDLGGRRGSVGNAAGDHTDGIAGDGRAGRGGRDGREGGADAATGISGVAGRSGIGVANDNGVGEAISGVGGEKGFIVVAGGSAEVIKVNCPSPDGDTTGIMDDSDTDADTLALDPVAPGDWFMSLIL
jgi:hypothetical protein